jgi:hypothetical protein
VLSTVRAQGLVQDHARKLRALINEALLEQKDRLLVHIAKEQVTPEGKAAWMTAAVLVHGELKALHYLPDLPKWHGHATLSMGWSLATLEPNA